MPYNNQKSVPKKSPFGSKHETFRLVILVIGHLGVIVSVAAALVMTIPSSWYDGVRVWVCFVFVILFGRQPWLDLYTLTMDDSEYK